MRTLVIAAVALHCLTSLCPENAESFNQMVKYQGDNKDYVNKRTQKYSEIGGEMVSYLLTMCVLTEGNKCGSKGDQILFMGHVTNENLTRCRDVRERFYPDRHAYLYNCVQAGK